MNFPEVKLKRVVILLLAALILSARAPAAAEPSFEDRAIALLLKDLARGFTAVADIEKIKRDNVRKIRRMDEEKFRKKCIRICDSIKDMPPAIKDEYRLAPDMSKEQVVRDIESLDKKKIYAIIDATPDQMLAQMFKRHLAYAKEKFQFSNFAVSVRKLWDNIVKGISVSPGRNN